jgi:endonuclease-3 related protein
MNKKLLSVYKKLLKHFGPQGWWPAETSFEVIVGAILTQSTSWKNVEKAIGNLKREGLLTPEGLLAVNEKKLARLVKPALYYNVKARKLKEFMIFLHDNYGNDLNALFSRPTDELRKELLDVWGVGPETADSILLYAAGKPSFVVDAYTKRIFHRIGLLDKNPSYDSVKHFFEAGLPEDVELYQEYHALIVELAKRYCKTKPACSVCCIKELCASGSAFFPQ